jgi:hypothetical protein
MTPVKLKLEEVFRTEGLPEFTFVPPPNYNEILLDVRQSHKPVILEGQSGTGKTSCVRHILDDLDPAKKPEYLTARDPFHVRTIEKVVTTPSPGSYVIDDFHRLTADLQEQIADVAKLSADLQRSDLPKLIIIGINQVGTQLIQLVPDIAKRTGIHRISPGRRQDIEKLIKSGCERLHIKIKGAEEIYNETRGDYWLTQQICQSICTSANVMETQEQQTEVTFSLADLRPRVVDKLRSNYYPAVKEFCRGKRFRPTNEPYFKLLHAVGQQNSSIVDLNEMANALPDVRGSINNIKEHRLQVLLGSKPAVAERFYYNTETKSFAIEDPALFYFIKHLDWDQLRQDCGFRQIAVDYHWDVALSFAGENRELAEYLDEKLTVLDVAVFYDANFEANYLGTTWSAQFKEIFGDKSRYVVCILDKHHSDKIWPTFEREIFMPRVVSGTVIPIFLDDTKFVGISHDLVGIKFKFDPTDPNWQKRANDEIITKLIDKLSE